MTSCHAQSPRATRRTAAWRRSAHRLLRRPDRPGRDGRHRPLVGAQERAGAHHAVSAGAGRTTHLRGGGGRGKDGPGRGAGVAITREGPEILKDAPSMPSIWGPCSPARSSAASSRSGLKAVVKALAEKPGGILFIDEIHMLVAPAPPAAARWTPPTCSSPRWRTAELRCIGSTTFSDFKASFDRDKALARRFRRSKCSSPAATKPCRSSRA